MFWCQEKLNTYMTPKSMWFNTNKILSIINIFSSNLVTKPSGTNFLAGCQRRRRETICMSRSNNNTFYFFLPPTSTHHVPHLIPKRLRNIILSCAKKERALVMGEYWELQPWSCQNDVWKVLSFYDFSFLSLLWSFYCAVTCFINDF